MTLLLLALLIILVPSGYNIALLFSKPLSGKRKYQTVAADAVCVVVGFIFTALATTAADIRASDWFEQIYNSEKHAPINLQSRPTVYVIMAAALLGCFLLRIFGSLNMPPLAAVLCISAMYLGAIASVVWCIQVAKHIEDTLLLFILPLNLLILFARGIRDVVSERVEAEKENAAPENPLHRLFKNAKNWPWLALIAAAPLLGILVALLTLFGQRPDEVIKMWSETADWTLSTKIPPQNIFHDYHYLCTVAAGGHKKVVRPLRTGIRHGHRVLVNRQLMVANAFEQLLEERLPRFHRAVRGFYDKTGYPIAKHIHSPFTADVIYIVMKPLEWLFLAVLYLFDKKPENRIAVQYPHSTPPEVGP